VSPNHERALAHHEIALALDEWLDCTTRALRPGGRLAAILPASREAELLGAMRARGLHPARVRLAQPNINRPPLRVLVEARAGAAVSLVREPALVIHAPGGGFSAEVAAMLGEAPAGL
jgi:tRNA1(Val) A37 N6-methylase TrmN6